MRSACLGQAPGAHRLDRRMRRGAIGGHEWKRGSCGTGSRCSDGQWGHGGRAARQRKPTRFARDWAAASPGNGWLIWASAWPFRAHRASDVRTRPTMRSVRSRISPRARPASRRRAPRLVDREIREDELARPPRRRADLIGGLHLEPMKSREDLAHLGAIVDREQEAPLDPGEQLGEASEIGAAKDVLAIIALAAEIGWVEVEERTGPIVAADELGIVEPRRSRRRSAARGCRRASVRVVRR